MVLVVNFVLDRYFGLDPVEKEARSYVTSGEQYLFQGDYESAIVEYEKAVEVLPDMPDAQVTLGVLYQLAGRESEAEKAFEAAREAFDSDLSYHLTVARAYEMIGDYERGMAAIEQAIAIDAESPEAYLTRGPL